MLMSLPRSLRISASGKVSRSRPWKRIAPAILPGGSWISRRIDIEVTDLPQPLSPTTASVSPASMWKDRPSTARTTPSAVPKWVCRRSTSSSAMRQSLLAMRGSSASRSPSPSRFTASTVIDRNTAGKNTI